MEKEMRQVDLGALLNVSYNTISSWERGNSSPSVDELKMLAEIFNITTDYLLGLED